MPNTDHRESRHGAEASEHPLRAVLFVDYENAYKRAAELFFPGQSKETGHFHPWKLGELICDRHNKGRRQSSSSLELIEARVYWGHYPPNAKAWHRKSQEQERRFDVWRNPPAKLEIRATKPNVRVISPPRQLPGRWYPIERERRPPPVEKEVDTAISVDLLAMAHAGEFDVAILFSEDNDQRSLVVEMLGRFRSDGRTVDGAPEVHLAGWQLSKKERRQWLQRQSEDAGSAKEKLLRTKWDSLLSIPDARLPDGCEMPQVHRVGSSDYMRAVDRRTYRVSQLVWETLEAHRERNDLVRVRGLGSDHRGNRVYVEVEDPGAPGIIGFVQRRELPGDSDAEAEDYVGRSFDAVVHRMNPETGRVEFSVRGATRLRLLDELREGEIRAGRITSIRPFGVFVDLGGADGLAHLSELSWERDIDPEQMFSIGQQVNVYITKIDKESKKIGLSIRRASPEQWDEVVAKFEVGQIVPGTVTKLVTFGAFARIEGPVEGLVHVSELADRRITHPREIVLENDVIPVKIVRIERDRHRLGLSLRQARSDAERAGWVFDQEGRIARLPDDVAEQFGVEPDQPWLRSG